LTTTRGGHIAAVCFRLRSPPDLYFATHRRDQYARGVVIGSVELFFHFGAGMAVRNLCREQLSDAELGAYCTAATNAPAGLNWLRSQPLDLEEVRQALNCIGDAKRAGEMIVRLRALMNKDVSFVARDPSETCRDVRFDAAFTIRRLG
jgi:hypothetical protein